MTKPEQCRGAERDRTVGLLNAICGGTSDVEAFRGRAFPDPARIARRLGSAGNLVLVVLMVGGCAVGEPKRLEVVSRAGDPMSAADTQAALEAAVAYWRACGEVVEIGPGGGTLTYERRSGPEAGLQRGDDVVLDDSGKVGWLAEDDDSCGAETLYLSAVLKHEIGHLLGYEHVAQVGELMYPILDPCTRVTACPGAAR